MEEKYTKMILTSSRVSFNSVCLRMSDRRNAMSVKKTNTLSIKGSRRKLAALITWLKIFLFELSQIFPILRIGLACCTRCVCGMPDILLKRNYVKTR
jgi:hypothetical protein